MENKALHQLLTYHEVFSFKTGKETARRMLSFRS